VESNVQRHRRRHVEAMAEVTRWRCCFAIPRCASAAPEGRRRHRHGCECHGSSAVIFGAVVVVVRRQEPLLQVATERLPVEQGSTRVGGGWGTRAGQHHRALISVQIVKGKGDEEDRDPVVAMRVWFVSCRRGTEDCTKGLGNGNGRGKNLMQPWRPTKQSFADQMFKGSLPPSNVRVRIESPNIDGILI
jgi:hypothetical protein